MLALWRPRFLGSWVFDAYEADVGARALREQGLYTFVRWNTFFTNPPLVITASQLDEAFEVIDRALLVTDRAVAA